MIEGASEPLNERKELDRLWARIDRLKRRIKHDQEHFVATRNLFYKSGRLIIQQGCLDKESIKKFFDILTSLHKHTNPLLRKQYPKLLTELKAIEGVIGRAASVYPEWQKK